MQKVLILKRLFWKKIPLPCPTCGPESLQALPELPSLKSVELPSVKFRNHSCDKS